MSEYQEAYRDLRLRYLRMAATLLALQRGESLERPEVVVAWRVRIRDGACWLVSDTGEERRVELDRLRFYMPEEVV